MKFRNEYQLKNITLTMCCCSYMLSSMNIATFVRILKPD